MQPAQHPHPDPSGVGPEEDERRGFLVRLAAAASLVVAGVQLLFFLPLVAEGRAVDVLSGLFPPLFRIDSLSLLFGVTWSLAIVLPAANMRKAGLTLLAPLLLMEMGLLAAAYARAPLVLYVGLEVAGIGLWLSVRAALPRDRRGWVLLVLHASGWPLLALIALGADRSFTPPTGGAAQAWSVPATLALATVALIRSGCWPVSAPLRDVSRASEPGGSALPALYALSVPYLLAKALVPAPWDPVGIWLLATLGAVSVAAGAIYTLWSTSNTSRSDIAPVAAVCAGTAITGFGLASSSPLCAAGAIAIIMGTILWAGTARSGVSSYTPLLLLGAISGLWLIAQGALDLRYGIVAAIILPAYALLTFHLSRTGRVASGRSDFLPLLPAAILVLAAVYPQGIIEWALRPAVSSMAGGVGVLSPLASDWGVGLLVRSPQETITASLPATGIVVGVLLAWVALYWLKRAAALFVRERRGNPTE